MAVDGFTARSHHCVNSRCIARVDQNLPKNSTPDVAEVFSVYFGAHGLNTGRFVEAIQRHCRPHLTPQQKVSKKVGGSSKSMRVNQTPNLDIPTPSQRIGCTGFHPHPHSLSHCVTTMFCFFLLMQDDPRTWKFCNCFGLRQALMLWQREHILEDES